MSDIKIKLGKRLEMCAKKVRQNSILADIGTDHGYIPANLVLKKICPSAIAADIGKGPLANAEKTVQSVGLHDKIQLRLSDGLKEIGKDEADDIVIAGMGGILITEILSACDWIYNSSKRFILQPMSHSEDVRRFLAEKGFKTVDEDFCSEDKHSYIVITAEYDGIKREMSDAFYYIGSFTSKENESSLCYIKKQYTRLKKRYDALYAINPDDDECKHIGEILKEIENT